MPDRILIVERDPTDSAVWSYGLADADGRLPAGVRCDYVIPPPPGSEPIGGHHRMWPTVVLLVRQAGTRNRVVYNLSPARDAPEPPPRPPRSQWELIHSLRSSGSSVRSRQRRD